MTYELQKKRIAYLANENVGNFQQMQGLASGSHAIGVGCYIHICIYGFLRPSFEEVRFSSRFFIIKGLKD